MRTPSRTLRTLLAAAAAVGIAVSGSVVAAGPSDGTTDGPPADDDLGDVAQNIPFGYTLGQPPNINVTCGMAFALPAPTDSCIVFSSYMPAPPGQGVLTRASVVAGPVTGPMRFVALRAFRSQNTIDGQPAPGGCCTVAGWSQVFTPTPNTTTSINPNLPMENRVVDIDGEPVETVDYLGLAVFGSNTPIPFFNLAQGPNGEPLIMGALPTAAPPGSVVPQSGFGTLTTGPLLGVPTISGIMCPGLTGASTRDAVGIGLAPVTDVPQNVCPTGPTGPGGGGGGGTPGGSGSSEFVGLTPARLLDTRGGPTSDGDFSGGGKLPGGQDIELDIAGRDDVPADADAVVLNVTVSDPENFGFVTAYPCGIDRPNASNINFAPGQTIPNSVIVKIGSQGKVCLYSDQTTHLLADVGGYLPSGASYQALDPARYLDTRGAPTFDGQFSTGSPLPGGQEIELDVAGRGDVPSDADAVVMNVTVTGPTAPGFITVYPCGTERPNASNLNFVAGQTIANTVVSKVGSDGRVCLFSDQTTHLLADIGGAFPAGSGFTSLDPARYLDTRGAPTFDGEFSAGAKLEGGQEIALDVAGRGDVPAGAGTVVMNVTVNDPEAFGFVTVYPCGVDRPNASNLNFAPGQTIPNSVIVKVGSEGRVCLFSDQTTHLFADVSGYGN